MCLCVRYYVYTYFLGGGFFIVLLALCVESVQPILGIKFVRNVYGTRTYGVDQHCSLMQLDYDIDSADPDEVYGGQVSNNATRV